METVGATAAICWWDWNTSQASRVESVGAIKRQTITEELVTDKPHVVNLK